jgi:hypothetical protein
MKVAWLVARLAPREHDEATVFLNFFSIGLGARRAGMVTVVHRVA